jgi:hypothetical protein
MRVVQRHASRVCTLLLVDAVNSVQTLQAGKYPLISEHLGDTTPTQQAYITSRMVGQGYFRYFEFFAPQQHYIEELLNETQRGADVATGGALCLPNMCS